MYQPNANSLPILGTIAQTLGQATVIPNQFSLAPAFLARLPTGQLYFDCALQLDTDGWPLGGQMGDPDWQSGTALEYPGQIPLNANTVPYFVLPKPVGWASQFGISLGDYAAVILDGQLAFAIFGDRGEPTRLGEGSLELLRQLGEERLKPDGHVINSGTRPGVITIVFPGSGSAADRRDEATLLAAIARTQFLFASIGGVVPGTPTAPLGLPANVLPLLNKAFTPRPLATIPTAKGRYYVVSLDDPESSGQALVWQEGTRNPRLLKTDTTVIPLPTDTVPAPDRKLIAAALASVDLGGQSLMLAARGDDVAPSMTAALAAQVATRSMAVHEHLNQAVLAAAKTCDGTLDTSQVPLTENGNLACAWAVNEVVREATGQTISRELLSTDSVYAALSTGARGISLSEAKAGPGSIIISPSTKKTHGHVGIVGEGGLVYSNSSSRKKFWHSYTIQSWKARYTATLRLRTLFFNLDPAKFGFTS